VNAAYIRNGSHLLFDKWPGSVLDQQTVNGSSAVGGTEHDTMHGVT
jgi:hypothetical protein